MPVLHLPMHSVQSPCALHPQPCSHAATAMRPRVLPPVGHPHLWPADHPRGMGSYAHACTHLVVKPDDLEVTLCAAQVVTAVQHASRRAVAPLRRVRAADEEAHAPAAAAVLTAGLRTPARSCEDLGVRFTRASVR
eukprot:364597-Chlamydomonas_euryale.AAC.13